MDVSEALDLIVHAVESGHPANGYLIVGGIHGNASELTEKILHHLFPDDADRLAAGTHPDVITLRPEGKLRIISVASMRENMVGPMSLSSFSGGWKVGIIEGADRLNPQSANAFLKSLEEPTERTMYLLLTEQPDAILPTIVSRCQRISLALPSGCLEGEQLAELKRLFDARSASGLAAFLSALKEEAEDEDVALVRRSFYVTLLSFIRPYLADGSIPRYKVLRALESVEVAYRRSERSMSDDMVLAGLVNDLEDFK